MKSNTFKMNPYSKMLSSQSVDTFFGRHLIIGKIIQGISSESFPNSYSIRGNRKIGKTSLLLFLCDGTSRIMDRYGTFLTQYGHKHGEIKFIYVNLERLDNELGHISFLYSKICSALPEAKCKEHNGKDDRDELHKLFRYYQKELDTRLVVCLDNFDNFFQSVSIEDEKFIRHLCFHQSIITVTEKSFIELKPHGAIRSPLVSILNPLVIGLLEKSEAIDLVTKPAIGTGISITEDDSKSIFEIAGLHPYTLTIACAAAFDLCLEYGVPSLDKILSTPSGNDLFKSKIGSSPAFEELFAILWKNLDGGERNTLIKIAEKNDLDLRLEAPTLNALRNKALIQDDLMAGECRVFSSLFRDYVTRQRDFMPTIDVQEIASSLAPLDRKLFEHLLQRANKVCTSEELYNAYWQDKDEKTQKRGLEAAIHRIRAKIHKLSGGNWEYIKNERGEGYIFVDKPSE